MISHSSCDSVGFIIVLRGRGGWTRPCAGTDVVVSPVRCGQCLCVVTWRSDVPLGLFSFSVAYAGFINVILSPDLSGDFRLYAGHGNNVRSQMLLFFWEHFQLPLLEALIPANRGSLTKFYWEVLNNLKVSCHPMSTRTPGNTAPTVQLFKLTTQLSAARRNPLHVGLGRSSPSRWPVRPSDVPRASRPSCQPQPPSSG